MFKKSLIFKKLPILFLYKGRADFGNKFELWYNLNENSDLLSYGRWRQRAFSNDVFPDPVGPIIAVS